MFAAASSFFARTAISQSYAFGEPGPNSRSSTPGPSTSAPHSPRAPVTVSVLIGLWKVQAAHHKVTNKRVSVWSFDKRGPDMDRLGQAAKDRTLEVLKAEASALSRLRHPSILEMVEPLEETRSELIFATEPIICSLDSAIPGSPRFRPWVELDEVEIQKGILQICKGLSFLHSSAKIIHSHICPDSVIINSAGDWKISGLGLTLPLLQPNGTPTRWEFPTFDNRVPSYIQRSFDYMAPEYALDEQLLTASDMYSLGVLIYAVHCKGDVPYQTHGSLGGIREHAGKPLPGMHSLDRDLQGLLNTMISRHSSGRPTPTTLPASSFFSSLPISTLNFLDRSTFATKTREEKVGFMKGLASVLDRFSEGLRTRKILPSLLEEMKDTNLLPYILPNVFAIASALSAQQFASMVLPGLKPLFAMKDPPQNMLTLLDNLEMLQSKTEKQVFKNEVLPLVYNALESEHAVVQERALKTVPGLCDTIDYAEVQGVLFPRIAFLFTKTTVLGVKVTILGTFMAMVKTLDQTSLTQKMVPLLSKIRTKEPAVMMATLSVQEAMGFKVDREAVATLVLPQLWSMSMGPLLNVDQFNRFMDVIRRLGERVEKEHNQFLRDSQRLEDRSSVTESGAAPPNFAGQVSFESLVASGPGTPAAGPTAGAPTPGVTGSQNGTGHEVKASWEDDVWGSIFNDTDPGPATPALPPPGTSKPNKLSKPLRTTSYTSPSAQNSYSSQTTSFPPPPSSNGARPGLAMGSPRQTSFSTPLQPTSTGGSLSGGAGLMQPTGTGGASKPTPNYNVSFSTPGQFSSPPLSPQLPAFGSQPPAFGSQPPTFSSPMAAQPPAFSSPMVPAMSPQPSLFASAPPLAPAPQPMGMGGLLQPSKPAQNSWNAKSKLSQVDWDDFDPLA